MNDTTIIKIMIWSKRKTTNKSTKIKTTKITTINKSWDEKVNPFLYGWDKVNPFLCVLGFSHTHTQHKQKEQLKFTSQCFFWENQNKGEQKNPQETIEINKKVKNYRKKKKEKHKKTRETKKLEKKRKKKLEK